jgi:hypothetical protein
VKGFAGYFAGYFCGFSPKTRNFLIFECENFKTRKIIRKIPRKITRNRSPKVTPKDLLKSAHLP